MKYQFAYHLQLSAALPAGAQKPLKSYMLKPISLQMQDVTPS